MGWGNGPVPDKGANKRNGVTVLDYYHLSSAQQESIPETLTQYCPQCLPPHFTLEGHPLTLAHSPSGTIGEQVRTQVLAPGCSLQILVAPENCQVITQFTWGLQEAKLG